MKKVFFLIALTVMVFAIVPHLSAQADEARRLEQLQQQFIQRSNQLEQELNQLAADFEAGRITMAQFQRRATEIQTEMQNMANQVNTAEQQYMQSGTGYTQAQLERLVVLYDQHKAIEAQRHDGRINQTQAERQVAPINREIEQIFATVTSPAAHHQLEQEIEKRLEVIWPGAQPGWPNTEEWNFIIENLGYGPFTQTRGTKTSFTINYRLYEAYIYQTGQPDVVFRELKNQIERITRGRVQRIASNTANYYSIEVPNPHSVISETDNYILTVIHLSKDDIGVTLSFTRTNVFLLDPRRQEYNYR